MMLIIVPIAVLVVVALLSFTGCSLIVSWEPLGPVLFSFGYDPKKLTRPIKRVVFHILRPDNQFLQETVILLKDPDNQLVWEPRPGTVNSNSSTYDWKADEDSGEFRASTNDAWKGPVGTPWRVRCRAYPTLDGNDDPYAEAEQIVQEQPDFETVDVKEWFARLHEFHFTINDVEPFQLIGSPTGNQTIIKQPDVFLHFSRPAAMKMQKVMKVAFKLKLTLEDSSEYNIVETITDLETHAQHVESTLWKLFGTVPWDESGSNDSGIYGMSLRNALPAKWSVSCEAFDSKTAMTATYPSHPTNGTVELDVAPTAPPASHEFRFKFKLEKMPGTGLGFTVVKDTSP
jgi:hypothetical protein